jgi:drug/metabolite transporter (DMT)-like permease
VNPIVAIFLGWLVLDEVITPIMLVGAAIIVVSVALVVRIEAGLRANVKRESHRRGQIGAAPALERDG